MDTEIRKQVDVLKQLLDAAMSEEISLGEKAGIYSSASIIVEKIFQRLEDHDISARNQVRTKGRGLVGDIAALIGFEEPRNTRDQHYVWGLGNHQAVVAYLKQGGVLT